MISGKLSLRFRPDSNDAAYFNGLTAHGITVAFRGYVSRLVETFAEAA